MIFVTIDDKLNCLSLYYNNKFHKPEQLGEVLDRTWSYSPYLDGLDIEYAKVYVKDKPLIEVCPEKHKKEFEIILIKLEAFFTSFKEAKVNPNDICLYQLIPKKLLRQYCDIKTQIVKHVFRTYKKPKNYEFHLGVHKLIKEISLNRLKLDSNDYPRYVRYISNQTTTNRLKTHPDSFPILFLKKEDRTIIKPTNHYFVELDFNGADLRTALGLLNLEQPEDDIVAWLGDKVWNGRLDRSDIKKEIYSWMYNPDKDSPQLDKILDRDKILSEYWNGQEIVTLMGETISADRKHAVSYLVQSSTHEVVFERILKLREYLKNTKSHIAFCIHDSVVIDLHEDDLNHMKEIKELFADTMVGKVKVNVSASGSDFGSMKKIC